MKPMHRQQRIHAYTSGMGVKVYEIEQYNAHVDAWYIVGDSTTSNKLARSSVKLHNLLLKKIKTN